MLDPQRYDSYPVTHPQLIVNQLPQGGERYEMLSIMGFGSISLSFARLRYNRYQATASRLGGQFVSSNDLLNKIWYDGAYTINLSQLLPGTPGMDWVADRGALNVQGGAFEGSGDGDATGILTRRRTNPASCAIVPPSSAWRVQYVHRQSVFLMPTSAVTARAARAGYLGTVSNRPGLPRSLTGTAGQAGLPASVPR